ncbi:MAG: CPBP family intramembrane metalloprotease [Leptolyngbya sp. Prado105]|nr:CPBP family intramembrane metalloprotease [Leptolyngbya sp. Prado105]
MARQNDSAAYPSSSLVIYGVITFVWSWFFWLISTLLRSQDSLIPGLIGAIATFGPTVGAIVVTGKQSGRAGIRTLLRRGFQWRSSWQWCLILFFVAIPLLLLSALAIHLALGGATPPRFPPFDHAWLVALNFILVLILGGPLGEEFGWRGFLLPTLQARMTPLIASIWIGVVWAGWHLPLFFIPGQLQQQFPFPLFLINTVGLSILFTWVYNNTQGSVLSAIVLHTAVNGWSGVIPILPEAAGSLRPYAIATLLVWIIAILIPWRTRGNY